MVPGAPLPEQRRWEAEYLGDVIVLGQRPSIIVPGTLDVDLNGFVNVYDRTDAVQRPGHVTEFVLSGGDQAHYGTCLDVTGVFRDQAAPPVPQVRLLGCRPDPPLLAAFNAIGQTTKAAERRRRVRAEVHVFAADGSVGPLVGAVVFGTVQAGEPSRLGAGLLDITIDSEPQEPIPTGVLEILDHGCTGRPAEKNLWAGYNRELRHYWAGLALGRLSGGPDRPAGTTYDLDGRFVTDIEGFYCAIGEAINGAGGYFGWNLDALVDCLRGRFGARTPFRLVWHNPVVAREHLVDGYDRHRLGPAVSLQYLVDLLAAEQVEIDWCSVVSRRLHVLSSGPRIILRSNPTPTRHHGGRPTNPDHSPRTLNPLGTKSSRSRTFRESASECCSPVAQARARTEAISADQ